MTELETVLKNLHDLRKYLEDKEWSDELVAPYINTVMKAEELLKKQIPVKPEIEGDARVLWWYVCGECHTMISTGDKFCKQCGRGIDWSGTARH